MENIEILNVVIDILEEHNTQIQVMNDRIKTLETPWCPWCPWGIVNPNKEKKENK